MNDLDIKPAILILFGITGDLAQRKVLPAIYHLVADGLLPPATKIVGVSRREVSVDQVLSGLEQHGAATQKLKSMLQMVQVDPANDQDYQHLADALSEIERQQGQCLVRLFYLSIPPAVYGPIIAALGRHNLNKGCDHPGGESRLLIEKPFGYDVTSAEQLIEDTEAVFSEEQIFRIDHYLAKETAQNILKFRRHNPIFSGQWNGQHISQIHVTAKESIGIENRVDFYENIGAMRDLVQSHLLQLLALTAMDLPSELNSDEVHAQKHRFLDSLLPPRPDKVDSQVTRAQYEGYLEEVNNPASTTETFVSLDLKSSDPAWADTSFKLTTGKGLEQKSTTIAVHFAAKNEHNVLTFRLQPDEGIDLSLAIEQPGFRHELQQVKLNFSYADIQEADSHDAYERVLIDAFRGDKLLFATKLEVMAAWRVLQPILDSWAKEQKPLLKYRLGSPGPLKNQE